MASEVRQTADRRRRQAGGDRWRLFRRLREARQSPREPPRSSAAAEPIRQAQGRGRDPRARRQDAARRVPQRRRRAQLHPPQDRAADRRSTPTKPAPGTSCMPGSRCTGSTTRKPTASADEDRDPHEYRREFFSPDAARRDRPPPPRCRPLPDPLRARGGMARGSSARAQRLPG